LTLVVAANIRKNSILQQLMTTTDMKALPGKSNSCFDLARGCQAQTSDCAACQRAIAMLEQSLSLFKATSKPIKQPQRLFHKPDHHTTIKEGYTRLTPACLMGCMPHQPQP
jgi:hypothetical protein